MEKLSEQQALNRLESLCAKAEYASGDMRRKMRLWGLPDDVQERIIGQLRKDRFIDDGRFCGYFIHDKIRYNKWGPRKIEQALRQKQIAPEVYEPVLNAVEESEYIGVLRPLLQSKWKSIRGSSDYERSQKLIRFALGRGFTLEQIKESTDHLELDDD